MKLLLDSHAVYWSLYEPERLPGGVSAVIEDSSNNIFVSHVCVWELVDKAAKFRLPVAGTSVDRIVERIFGLRATMVPVALEDIVASAKLPQHHGDPMDRVLIAQAARLGARLLSKDRKFALYGVDVFWP
ncbi:MAG: type II toxin-antitoxin system VapC family toxin [Acidobacteriota bacterium]